MSADDQLSAYDYPLPTDLIAHLPADRRDGSRLMTLSRTDGAIAHHQFTDLPGLLQPGDLLVLNNTRVLPARLHGHRKQTGGKWEGLFLHTLPNGRWSLIGKAGGKIQPGEVIVIPATADSGRDPLELTLVERGEGGSWVVVPDQSGEPAEVLSGYGQMPLPPYIERPEELAIDAERYQTTFAQVPGAVAAPTAGLHFTPELLQTCRDKGVDTAFVTLHVGIGTFRPVSVENLSEHLMHSEWGQVSAETVAAIQACKARGGRVLAVGTTSVRTLESAARNGELTVWSGETDIFIRPPYQFRVIDGVITNFHLPKSTLLMLVSALSQREWILSAYQTAIENRYRFFSYGDAMLIA